MLDRSMASLRRMAAAVSSLPVCCWGSFSFWGLGTRDTASDYTLTSGEAVFNGFALEIFEAGPALKLLVSSSALASAQQELHQTQSQLEGH